MAEYCEDGRFAVYTYYWQNQNQYAARSGKFIGVGDDDVARQQNYLGQYGYLMPLIGTGVLDALLSSGFSANNIMIGLGNIGWADAVEYAIAGNVTRFYIDEPIQKSRQNVLRDAAPYIAARGGTLTISESEFSPAWYYTGYRGNIGDMVDLALSVSPSPLVSCHTHFEHYQIWHDIDPRDQWTYIMGRVPNLFKMAWIKTRQTSEQMGLLFGHANNIGINQILLYPFDADGTTYVGRVEIAAEQAWYSGWLSRLQKQVVSKWCCLHQQYDPDECYFDSSYYSGQERWV